MNRREALKRVAWLMGGTISAPAILAVRDGYSATETADARFALLSPPQAGVVSAVAEIMIPRTDTPGAIDTGVPQFIDRVLKDVYTEVDRQRYVAGLATFDAAAQREYGGKFVALQGPQQVALVRKFHDTAIAEERTLHPRRGTLQRPFILMTKELTLLGFFTSKPGATQLLQYKAIPGAYHGCLPVADAGNGKTWAVQPGLRF
jgi:gluconate 2-dehydrogenase gamma chain